MSRFLRFTAALLLAMVMLSACSPGDDPLSPDKDTDAPGNNPATVIVTDDEPVDFNTANTFNLVQYSAGNIYFQSMQSGRGKRPMRNSDLFKYTPGAGVLTYACRDAVCDHTTPDCPLYGHTNFCCYNDQLYYDRNFKYTHTASDNKGLTETFMGFVAYDTVNGKLRELSVKVHEVAETPTVPFTGSVIGLSLYTSNYRFFFQSVPLPDSDDRVKALRRMNLETGEVVTVDATTNLVNGQPSDVLSMLFAVDGRLYLSDLKSLFSVDLDGGDKKIIAEGVFTEGTKTNGQHIVWCDPDTKELHAMELDGSNPRSLGVCAHSFKINQKNLYYLENKELSLGVALETGAEETVNGLRLMRYSFETESAELLYDLHTDDMHFYSICGDNWLVSGGRFYARYYEWTLPEKGRLSLDKHRYDSGATTHVNTILTIDLASGELGTLRLTLDE